MNLFNSKRKTRVGIRAGQTKLLKSTFARSFGKNVRRKITKKAFGRTKKILIFSLIFFTFTFTVLYSLRKILVIRTVDCVKQNSVCDEELVKTLAHAKGKPVYEAKLYLSENLKKEKKLQSFNINIIFPNKIKVSIIERDAKLGLKNLSSKWITEVDAEGVVTKISENSALPVIETEEPLKNVGDLIDNKARFATEIFLGINKTAEIDKGRMINNLLLIKLKSEPIIFVFPLSGDKSFLVGAFNLILSRLNNNDKESTIEKSEISEIDFRFKYPVIRRIKTFDF